MIALFQILDPSANNFAAIAAPTWVPSMETDS